MYDRQHMPSSSKWKASGEILYLRLLLVFGSKWRDFVHEPSFGVWKASGEILYTRLFLVFGKQVEKYCTHAFF